MTVSENSYTRKITFSADTNDMTKTLSLAHVSVRRKLLHKKQHNELELQVEGFS